MGNDARRRSPAATQSLKYRPEIDGLRAIAVTAVVLFHAGFRCPGGFVGVDVFFVISGYLITSLILRDLEKGRFSLAEFWERRARRILPAAAVMVLAILGAGCFLLIPSDAVNLGISAICQSLFAANFYFWLHTGYFDAAAEDQPLLHMWSLAVEEQFYILLPFVLLGVFGVPAWRNRRAVAWVLGFLALASLAASVWLLPTEPSATFFLLPGRAWELLAGSLTALLPTVVPAGKIRSVFCLLAWLGLAGIAAACFFYTARTPFPGLAALLPCLGTALFIWSTSPANTAQHPLSPTRLLTLRPVVFVGLISYSLYLWHWPVLAIAHYWSIEPASRLVRIGLVLLGFILAVISWRFVERPFRERTFGRTRKAMFAWSGAVSAAVLTLAGILVGSGGIPAALWASPLRRLDVTDTKNYPPAYTLENTQKGEFPRMGADGAARRRIFLWGDSHARAILPAIDQLGKSAGAGVVVAYQIGTPPLVDFVHRFSPLGKDAPAAVENILRYLEKEHFDVVILAKRWSPTFDYAGSHHATDAPTGAAGREAIAQKILRTVARLRATGAEVWILREVPTHHADPLKALRRELAFGERSEKYAATPGSVKEQNLGLDQMKERLLEIGVRMIDVSDRLYEAPSGTYAMERDGIPLYRDDDHLNEVGALQVAPGLREILDDVDAGAASGENLPDEPVDRP